MLFFFFFKQKTAYEMRISDWSSDVCSSDLDGHDQGDAAISEAELRDIHGLPYVAAIDAGVQTVMTSFSSWHGVKMAGNKSLVTGVLKDRMGFGGFVVSDWNAHGQVAGCTNQSCPQAINADRKSVV